MVTSANTSINKDRVPAVFTKVGDRFSWRAGGINLDIGGGKYDTATEYLHELGVINIIYDPYNRSEDHNGRALKKKYDTVTISNVLNVIESELEIYSVLQLAHRVLKKHGTVYITIYNSGKTGISKKDCFQRGVSIDWYVPFVEKFFGDVQKKFGMIIAKKRRNNYVLQ